jgi:hypothetical protein
MLFIQAPGISDDEAASTHRIPHTTLRSLK